MVLKGRFEPHANMLWQHAVIDREESPGVSIAHGMGDVGDKCQIMLKLSTTAATPYLCNVCF